MTVRELFVKIGFKVDRASIKRVKAAIKGIKSDLQKLGKITLKVDKAGVRRVKASVKALQTNVKKLGKITFKVNKASARKAKSSIKNVGSSLQRFNKIAKVAGAIFSAGLIFRGFKGLIDVASEAAEAANKFGAVFGDAAESTQKAIDEVGKRTGASVLQIRDFTASIGALIKPSLGSAEAAGEMATGIAALALDIASFNDIDAEDALAKLRSGLVGQSRPLIAVGVDIRVAALQLDKFAASLGKTASQLTAGEKIQARYNSIVRQLKSQGALGDFEKTQGDLANASRNLKGRLKEVAVVIGSFFLKSAKDSTRAFLDLTNRFLAFLKANREFLSQKVPEVLQKISRFALNIGRFFFDIGKAVFVWFKNLNSTSIGFLKLIGLAVALGAVILIPQISLLTLAALVALLIDDFQVWKQGGESLIGTFVEGFNLWLDQLGGLGDAVRFLGSIFFELGKIVDAQLQAIFNFFASLLNFVAEIFTDGITVAWKNLFSNLKQIAFDALGGVFEFLKSVLGPINKIILAVGAKALDFAIDVGIKTKDLAASGLNFATDAAEAGGRFAARQVASVLPGSSASGTVNQQNQTAITINAAGMSSGEIVDEIERRSDTIAEKNNRNAMEALTQ